jgi:hypothetical protein
MSRIVICSGICIVFTFVVSTAVSGELITAEPEPRSRDRRAVRPSFAATPL